MPIFSFSVISSTAPSFDGKFAHGSMQTYGASVFGACQKPTNGMSGNSTVIPPDSPFLFKVTLLAQSFKTIASLSNKS